MAYTKTVFVNGSTPAINATNLNKIEDALESLSAAVDDLTDRVTALEGV